MERTSATVDPYTDGGGGINIRRHLEVVRGRFWTIFACVVVFFSVAAVRTFRATPIYEASARLLIERRLPLARPFEDVRERRDTAYFATQVNLITSKAVLKKALEDQRMAGLFEEGNPLPVSRPGLLRSAIRELRAVVAEEHSRPEEPWEKFSKAITVRPVKGTDLVDVSVCGPDPGLNALMATTVARAYVSHSVATRQESAGEAFETLQRHMKEQERALMQAEDDLLAYRESTTNPELGSPGQESPVMHRLRTLNEEYTKVRLRRMELSAAYETIRHQQEQDGSLERLLAVGLIRGDAIVQQLHARLMQVQPDIQRALRSYGEKHPAVLALTDERDHFLVKLHEAISAVADSIQAEHTTLQVRERELTGALAQERQLALEQARNSHLYERLERDAGRQARVFEAIVDRMKEVDLSKDAGITNVRLVEEAVMPHSPIEPRKQRSLFLGALLGLVFGISLAYGLEHLDDTVKTPDDVEKRLNMPWLGYVPRMRTTAGGHDGFVELAQHALTHPSSYYTEAFRSIRTNVYFSGQRGQIKSLMVTSAAPQEGKSVLAANLAAIMAQDDKRVLLVDADLRRPAIHEAFDLSKTPGLTNLLVEGQPLQEMVRTPPDAGNGKLENLHILCAGRKVPNPSELLGGEAMARFVRETRQQYDMVIYDACPAMFVADAAGLASGCDGTVLVLRAAKTRYDAAELAKKQLEAVQGKLIGVVLNEARPKVLRRCGAYGYYYYHGYYDTYGE